MRHRRLKGYLSIILTVKCIIKWTLRTLAAHKNIFWLNDNYIGPNMGNHEFYSVSDVTMSNSVTLQ